MDDQTLKVSHMSYYGTNCQSDTSKVLTNPLTVSILLAIAGTYKVFNTYFQSLMPLI